MSGKWTLPPRKNYVIKIPVQFLNAPNMIGHSQPCKKAKCIALCPPVICEQPTELGLFIRHPSAPKSELNVAEEANNKADRRAE